MPHESAVILDAAYGNKPFLGVAAQWVQWQWVRLGGQIDRVAPDWVLISAAAPQLLPSVRRIAGMWRKKRHGVRIIVGGGIGLSPATLDDVADVVCVGEGATFLLTLASRGYDAAVALPNAWVPGESRAVAVDQDWPWTVPPILGEMGWTIYASRGCRQKCAFCHTGWATTYRESPHPDVLATRAEACKPLVVGTNDALGMTSRVLRSLALGQPAVSMSAAGVRRHWDELIAAPCHQVRIGVEGVSERLRLAVGKRCTNDDLIEMTLALGQRGKAVRWFLIAGLPGETDDDWQECRDIVQRLKMRQTYGVVHLSWTAWVPEPAAPLGLAAIRDDYWDRWVAFKSWFFGGPGWGPRIKISAPRAPTGRLKAAMQSMAVGEADLRRGFERRPNAMSNARVMYPYADKRMAAYRRYCDVAIARWEAETGESAVRINNGEPPQTDS